jgi:hypothetical protein
MLGNYKYAPLVYLAVLLAPALQHQIVANVFHEPENLLKQTFPGARIQRHSIYVSQAEQQTLREKLGFAPVTRHYSIYEAWLDAKCLGYAFFDTQNVRTKDETLFIAIDPQGSIIKFETVSFFEPEDYLPPARWLKLFLGKTRQTRLVPGHDIPIISGATLTARAASRTARLMLELHSLHSAR